VVTLLEFPCSIWAGARSWGQIWKVKNQVASNKENLSENDESDAVSVSDEVQLGDDEEPELDV
jgi:hypothetical protein